MEQLSEDMRCPVCLELPRRVMDCAHCHGLFCEPCVNTLRSAEGPSQRCPKCRLPADFRPNDAIRQIIANCIFVCGDCKRQVANNDREHHSRLCERRLRKCPFCAFESREKPEARDHLLTHSEQIYHMADKLSCRRTRTHSYTTIVAIVFSLSRLKLVFSCLLKYLSLVCKCTSIVFARR